MFSKAINLKGKSNKGIQFSKFWSTAQAGK